MNGVNPIVTARIAAELARTAAMDRRFDAAKAALTGLLASTPATTQATSNFDQYATRAVRYADALIEALNRSHEEAAHARHR